MDPEGLSVGEVVARQLGQVRERIEREQELLAHLEGLLVGSDGDRPQRRDAPARPKPKG